MAEIVVRRRQADPSRTASDMAVPLADRRHAARTLRSILHVMQRERGQGLWSDADPEVLIDGAFAGRLRKQGSVEELVTQVLERLYPE